MKCFVVAYDKNRLIGGNNTLLWQGEMAADMRHFREITTGNVVIMGRKTYESIGKPLPNRQNIVVTRQPILIDGVLVAHSIEEAYELAEPGKDICIIGGGQIFELAMSTIDTIFATEIDASFNGDVYFSELPAGWTKISCEGHKTDDKNKYDYSFVILERKV